MKNIPYNLTTLFRLRVNPQAQITLTSRQLQAIPDCPRQHHAFPGNSTHFGLFLVTRTWCVSTQLQAPPGVGGGLTPPQRVETRRVEKKRG